MFHGDVFLDIDLVTVCSPWRVLIPGTIGFSKRPRQRRTASCKQTSSRSFCTQVLDLATQVFAVAVISWSGVRADLVLGLGEDDAQLVDGTSARAASPASASPAHPGVMARRERVNRHKLLTLLPCALDSLTSVEPWKQVTGRVSCARAWH